MAETEKKETTGKRISEKDRMRYIGFEVFPGQPKDLFKNEDDKEKWVAEVRDRRSKGDILRSDCILLEPRVSLTERIVLAVASLVMFAALFLPWYSVFNEIVNTAPATSGGGEAALVDSLDAADSAMVAMSMGDTMMDTMMDATGDTMAMASRTGQPDTVQPAAGVTTASQGPSEEIITGRVAKRSVRREYERVSGIGSFVALGSVGSHVFSGGFVLILTGIILLINVLLCVLLPGLSLYCLFGLKGSPDEVAIKMKRALKLNWLPLVLFGVMLLLSFIGANYGSGTMETFTSLGTSYGPDTLLGTLTWGIYVSIAASVMIAVKAIEI